MSIRFTARAFCKLLSVYVFSYFPFGSEGRMWDLIVSVPDYCLSFYFVVPSVSGVAATTFYYSAIKDWNSLPSEVKIRTITTVSRVLQKLTLGLSCN